MHVEIAVQDAAGAEVARRGGADRIELCAGLDLGGLTPSLATISQAVATGIGVHVLIRPRRGGFVFAAPEVSLMVQDIEAALDEGVAGVVIGALTPAQHLDPHAIEALVGAAEGATVTLHRCIDAVNDPMASLAQLPGLGVDRVLTSGGAPSAASGTHVLKRMVAQASDGLEIMAGGAVRPEHCTALGSLGIDAVHLSARSRSLEAGLAGPGGGPAGHDVTDAQLVTDAVTAARTLPTSA